MSDDAQDTGGGEEPRIPRPPSPEALDVLSGAQGLITDEWAPQPAPDPSAEREDERASAGGAPTAGEEGRASPA